MLGRVVFLVVAIAALAVAVVSSAPAHEPDRMPVGQLPPGYVFYVDETPFNGGKDGNGRDVVDGLSRELKALKSKVGSPSNVNCGVASREQGPPGSPEFEFSSESIRNSRDMPYGETYAAPCKVTGKVTMKKRHAELLGFRRNSFTVPGSPAPVFPMYNRQEPRGAYGSPRGSHFHFVLPKSVRSKFERVKLIKGLTVGGFVTGPKSHGSRVVEVKTARGVEWSAGVTGRTCVAPRRDLFLEPRNSKPYCPRGFALETWR